MARLTQIQIAQKYALQGDIESSMRELLSIKERGDIAVNASLAEIYAFKRQWADVLQCGQLVVKAPLSVRTLNVYSDMIHLIALSGLQTGDWEGIQRCADIALTKLAEKQLLPGYVDSVTDLVEFATSNGQALYVWGSRGVHHDKSEEERIEGFEAALDKLSKSGKKRFKTSEKRRDHIFSLARMYGYYSGAVDLYDREGLPELLFDSVVFIASGLARCGREEEAWQAIRSKLHLWWPVEETQVVPVVLLIDEALRVLMTPERCEEVLRTPKGAEADVK